MNMNNAALTYRIGDSKNMKMRAQVFKTEAGARAKARHLEMCHGRIFMVTWVRA